MSRPLTGLLLNPIPFPHIKHIKADIDTYTETNTNTDK